MERECELLEGGEKKTWRNMGENIFKKTSEQQAREAKTKKLALERTKFPSTEQKKAPEFIISSWHLTVTAVPSSYSERVVFYS